MKLRRIVLFIIAAILLILGDLPGGSLLALFAWLQVYNQIAQKTFDRKTQTWAALLFLSSLPFLFFWGSIHSFLFIYLNEKQFLLTTMALVIDCCLCLAATVYFVFAFDQAKLANFEVIKSLNLAFASIKTKKTTYFKLSCFFLIFSLIPFINADWKIVFSVMATQLFVFQNRQKLGYESTDL